MWIHYFPPLDYLLTHVFKFSLFKEYTSIDQVPETDVPVIIIGKEGSTVSVKKCAGMKSHLILIVLNVCCRNIAIQ